MRAAGWTFTWCALSYIAKGGSKSKPPSVGSLRWPELVEGSGMRLPSAVHAPTMSTLRKPWTEGRVGETWTLSEGDLVYSSTPETAHFNLRKIDQLEAVTMFGIRASQGQSVPGVLGLSLHMPICEQ